MGNEDLSCDFMSEAMRTMVSALEFADEKSREGFIRDMEEAMELDIHLYHAHTMGDLDGIRLGFDIIVDYVSDDLEAYKFDIAAEFCRRYGTLG